jgi:hypothetical protein
MRRAAPWLLALAALPAAALEEITWPPSGDAAARMRELQQAIVARDATPAQRDAAREELGRMLMSNQRPLPDDKGRKPRAAIDPYPSVVKPVNVTPPAPPPAGGVARMEVTEPSRASINPRTGTAVVPITPIVPAPNPPSPGFAVDPRTGTVLHPAGSGYVDPRTGQFTPR